MHPSDTEPNIVGRKRQLLVRWLVIPSLVLVALMAAMPVWLPWLLKPAAKSYGVNFQRYEREGYSRFLLHQLTFTNKTVSLSAERVGAFTPPAWLWNALKGRTNSPFLQVHQWEATQNQSQPGSGSKGEASVFTNIANAQRAVDLLLKWMPYATLTNGLWHAASNQELKIPEITWLAGRLRMRAVQTNGLEAIVDVTRRTSRIFDLAASIPNLALQMDGALTNTGSEIQLSGAMLWQSNRVALAAEFGRSSVLPQSARVVANDFAVPGQMLKLEQYGNLTGTLRGNWNAAGLATNDSFVPQFELELNARGAPASAEMPPIEIVVRASGTTNRARIDSAEVRLPWLDARFSEQTEVQFSPPFLTAPAALHVRADLSRQEQIPGTGILEGGAQLFPSTNRYPRVAFHLNGTDVTVSNLQMRSVQLEGEFEWPLVQLRGTRVRLTDGSEALVAGTLDLETRMLENGVMRTEGAFGRDLLPQGYEFESLSGESHVQGALTNLEHAGSMRLTQMKMPGGKPIDIALNWNGTRENFRRLELQIVSGAASVRAVAAGGVSRDRSELTLHELAVHTSARGDLVLQQPVTASFSRGVVTNSNAWRLDVSPVLLTGPAEAIEMRTAIDWPSRGAMNLSATNLSTDLLADFIKPPKAPVVVDTIQVKTVWTNGPMLFGIAAQLRSTNAAAGEFALHANISGDEDATVIHEFSLSTSTQVVARAEGTIPMALRPGSTNGFLDLRSDGELNVRAFTETNSAVWNQLAEQLPIRLIAPELHIDISGTWVRPSGVIRAKAEKIELTTARAVPSLTDLNLNVNLDEESARAELKAAVQEQPVSARGVVPLGRGFWESLRNERRLPDWHEATAELHIENAKLAAFVDFAPEVLAPQGDLTVNARLEPGMRLGGELILYNAGTRPLQSLGPVRGIDARILFAGTNVVLTNFTAEIGGQRVRAQGNAALNEAVLREKQLPDFNLHVRGENVPLVRQASVLVRSDLNLSITNRGATNGVVSGKVQLRESFFLSSLGDLAPGRVASPKRRPPYFSLDKEPFAGWRLNLDVEGERFLRAQSPFFRGTVSTTMRVEGTLKEPLALGEVRINSGTVTFPFGSLDVKQGFVSLTSADPYHPQLFVSAEAQRMGYDIQMDVTGPADQPVVQFSSSPPLSSEQIVLMLTTGQTPQGVATATSTRQRAQGIALFVGKNILSDIGIGGGGDGRLTIRSGEQVTDSGKPTYDLEYRLTDDWSVVGEYDRFSQYNLGMKWRVYTK